MKFRIVFSFVSTVIVSIVLSVSQVQASCINKTIQPTCSVGQFSCLRSLDSVEFCCTQINECNQNQNAPLTCSDGKQSGYKKCGSNGAFNVIVNTCVPGGNPEYQFHEACEQSETCVDGIGCQVNNPPPGNNNPPPNDQVPPPDPGGADGKFLFDIDPLNPAVNNAGPLQYIRWLRFQTPGGFLSNLLPYLFTFAGLILFVMILWGGFEMLTGAMDTKSQEAGKQRITAALTGFVLLFISYWVAQMVQYVFGLSIL